MGHLRATSRRFFPAHLLVFWSLCLAYAGLAATTLAQEPAAEKAPTASTEYGKVLFEPHIREILSAHCYECHGPKQLKVDFESTSVKPCWDTSLLAISQPVRCGLII